MMTFLGIIFLIILWVLDAGVLVLLIWIEVEYMSIEGPQFFILVALP